MRVGLFLSNFPIYYLPWACEIVDGLAARGLEIDLYLQNAGEKAPVLRNNVNMINLSNPALRCSQEELDYVARQNIPFSHLLSPASIGLTQIISEKKKYDYCIGLESKGLLLAKIAADASGCRLGYLSFELYDEKNPGVWGRQIKDVRKFESLLMPEIDLFMIQDETRHNEYFKILNTNRRPQNTMYFPVSLPRVCLSEKPRYWHERYNLPEEFKIVFYIGQICSNRLVDKMVMGAQSFDDDQLLVVHGPAFGNINDILRQLKQLDKKNKVIFSTDEVDCNEMKYLVASADIGLAFYSTDRINDFTAGKSSAKLARYMQAGIPVICPEYPTFKDVVDKYHNGECFSDFARLPQLVNRIFDNYSYYCKGAKQAFGYIYNLDKYLNVLSKHIKNGNCSNISGTLSVDTTWEQVRRMPVIRLYAGDVPKQKEYEGVIGLSLTKNDQNHLQHDITQPFPLIDNTVDSFQTEDVFEHIPFEKLAPVVNEIYRVLKPRGLFRLSVPDYGCDVLQNRSIKDEKGQIVFDPGGGGTPENPGHVWFPRIDTVMQLLTKTKFHESGKIELLHYYNKDGTFVAKPIDYSKGHIMRTPDFDERVKAPYRPMSLVIDLTKGRGMVPQNSVKPAPTQLYKNSQNREEFLPLMTVKNDKKSHYGKEYFDWQKNIGSFGGLANLFKFKEFINITDTVIDFGCGGGYLLRNLQCKEKIGIEVNPHARQEAKRKGIKVVESADEVPDKCADIIISNHALEHVGNPLEVLKKLRKKLKNNGKIIFVVPHQDTREEYDSADKNKHLYTWNQMTLGNLFSEAGYEVLKAKAFQHQWPPNYIEVCSQYGEEEFHKRCREYAIKNDNYQIRIVATKNSRIRNYVTKDIPVILVCYNRPKHTLEVLKALKEHSIKNIYIFSDAAKSTEDAEAVSLTRRLVHSINWTKPKIIERKENLGLAQNIVSAVDYVFERHNRLILLEDDCVPQRYFFDFMTTCLQKYEDNPKVFGISGHTVQIPDEILRNYPYDLYFSPRIGSWGWGTWKRAWKHRGSDLLELIDTAIKNGVDIDQGGTDIPLSLENILRGEVKDVWTLHWVLSIYINNGVYVYPTRSHIRNIGTDGTGIHCGKTTIYDSPICNQKPVNYPETVFLDQKVMINFRKYFDINPARRAQVVLPKHIERKEPNLTIGYVSANDIKGGAQKVAWMLKHGLKQRGFLPKMFVGHKFSNDPDVEIITDAIQDSGTHYTDQGYMYYDVNSTFQLVSQPEFMACDVVHYHNLHGNYFNPFALCTLTKSKPSVWTLHDIQSMTGHCARAFDCLKWQSGCGDCPYLDSYPPITQDRTAEMWRDKKLIYKESDFELIVPSKWLKNIVEKSILKDKTVHLIYNGIDRRIYKPYDRFQARRKFNVPDNSIVLAFAANGGLADKAKGSDFVLAAYQYFVSKYKNVYFICIGGQSNKAPTERFLQIPYVVDENLLAELYCVADVFMFPTLSDNCPLVVLELMGCGVPVVSFDIGGVPELIEHNRTGFIAGYKNAEEFVRMVEHLMLNKAKREQFSKAGLERLQKMFTLDQMINKHIALYGHIAEQGKKKNYVSPKNKVAMPAAVGEKQYKYMVSAIVSTYNSEKFIRGCLEDLENQTIADKLEIIVINSGSQENEETIVKEFQQRHDNIKYIKTEQREGIYTAWNRAVKVARGTFLTNANTDDRHREDALEIMAETLLANPDVALAYGDQICTDTPNGTFVNHHAIEMARRAEYSHERLLFGCCVGSQPIWRKSLHTELGYFDDTLTCAGDWDFWLRISISNRYKFKHIPEFLGLYYYNENGIEHGRKIHSLYERYIVGKRYGNPYISVIPLYTSKDNPLVSVIMTVYNCAEYIGDAIESVLIQNYPKFELIIINDGSTDSTKEVISRYEDQRIRYFYQENTGMSNALNHAVRQARGQYIMPLDADDMMFPNFIAKHLSEFEKHPDADLVYCDVLLIDENSKPIRIMNKPEYQDRRYLIRDLFRAGHPVVPFRLGIKRTVYDKIGLYDEKLKVGMDYDMMRRFVKAGLKEHHLSEPLHLRRMHADSLSGNQSAQKAKSHFEVIKRFIDTFAYDELFPEVAWDEIAPQIRQLHAKCLAAGTYLTIGQNYVRTKAIECSRIAFDLACSELNDCVKMDPENQGLRQLLQKSKLIRAKYTEAPQQVVS